MGSIGVLSWGRLESAKKKLDEQFSTGLVVYESTLAEVLPGNVDPVPSPGPPAPGGTGNPATLMGSGTVFADRVELLQAPGCNCKLLKEVPGPRETARCLLVSIQDNQYRVLLEAAAGMELQSGHFIG